MSANRRDMSTTKSYVVVVGVDYSESSWSALREALRLAALHSLSEVHALHVEATATSLVRPTSWKHAAGDTILSEAFPRLERMVNAEVAAFRAEQPPGAASVMRVLSHIRSESPARELAQLASDLEADLVVVGSRGSTGLSHLLLGSVAHGVVSLAPCPVLVLRPKHELPSGPAIEPPCPDCLDTRRQSGGSELWCAVHREHHGQRRPHTYFQDDRSAVETNFPLVFDER